jgi:hypothetical protein
MAHDHAHSDEGYYLDQLCAIGISGAIGLVMFLLWYWGGLYYLMSTFTVFVMLGGCALMLLALIRGVALWVSVGKEKKLAQHEHHHHDHCHDHGHDHGHDCGHDHAHHHHHDHDHSAAITGENAGTMAHHHHDHTHTHDHSSGISAGKSAAAGHHHHVHDHAPEHGPGTLSAHVARVGEDHYDDGHDHGWAPWRYAVLVLPVMLFLLDLPPRSPVEDQIDDGIPYMRYDTVSKAANDPQARLDLLGKQTHMRGYFAAVGDRTNVRKFQLVRLKMNCCAMDAIPVPGMIVRVRPESPAIDGSEFEGGWVDITGQLDFEQLPGDGELITLIWLDKIVKRDKPDVRQFIE